MTGRSWRALSFGVLCFLYGSGSLAGASADVARLQDHFAEVLSELRSARTDHLSDAQKAQRATLIDALEGYKERGRFPHNHKLAGARHPVFVDEHGTRCAVGYLMHKAGDDKLVSSIAQEQNLAFIKDLKDDPRLVAWLADVGLTWQEAARIQPSYTYEEPKAAWLCSPLRCYGERTLGIVKVQVVSSSPSGTAEGYYEVQLRVEEVLEANPAEEEDRLAHLVGQTWALTMEEPLAEHEPRTALIHADPADGDWSSIGIFPVDDLWSSETVLGHWELPFEEPVFVERAVVTEALLAKDAWSCMATLVRGDDPDLCEPAEAHLSYGACERPIETAGVECACFEERSRFDGQPEDFECSIAPADADAGAPMEGSDAARGGCNTGAPPLALLLGAALRLRGREKRLMARSLSSCA